MKPIDEDLPLWQQLATAWQNAREFDREGFQVWLRGRPERVQRLAQTRPPWRVYKLNGAPVAPCAVVLGYAEGVVVQFLGAGGAQAELPVEALEPVPDKIIHQMVKHFKELHQGG